MTLRPYFKLDEGYEFVARSMKVYAIKGMPLDMPGLVEKYYSNMMLAASSEVAYMGSGTIAQCTLVEETVSPWVIGSYYAHEYKLFVRGRGRKYIYSNGYVIYEIECLDKKLIVADGFWEEPSSNGCGDTFQEEEKL